MGLIVFDVDGTFLDSYTLFEKVVLDYSRAQNLPRPALEAIRWGYSDPRNHDFKWGVSIDDQVAHLITIFNLMDDWSMSGDAARTPGLFAGVEESLAQLKDSGHTLAIVTSKPEAPLLHLLAHHKVESLFSAHRNWDDIARRGEREKPEPDMLLSVMKELDFKPGDTIMVGDTIMDVKMGRAAKTHTIGVAWGMHPVAHLNEAGAHHIADGEFREVVASVKKIFGEGPA